VTLIHVNIESAPIFWRSAERPAEQRLTVRLRVQPPVSPMLRVGTNLPSSAEDPGRVRHLHPIG
jgi:hypothetical protein